jgi:hypothetical protein
MSVTEDFGLRPGGRFLSGLGPVARLFFGNFKQIMIIPKLALEGFKYYRTAILNISAHDRVGSIFREICLQLKTASFE